MFLNTRPIFVAAILALAIGAGAGADDPKVPGKPTVEFKMITGGTSSTTTKITMIIEVDGATEKFEEEIGLAGTCTPRLQAMTYEAQLKFAKNWVYKADLDNGKIIIEGWLDPKTKKLHPVKKIDFKFLNVPADCRPTATLPPQS